MNLDTNSLTIDMDANIPTITEEKFRNNFLRLFTNELPEELVPTATSAWVGGVAGTSTMPVHVVDSKNNVLFTVPPIIDTGRITITDGRHFSHMISAYTTLQTNRPEQAKELLSEEISSALENSLIVDTSNRLEAMLDYYGLLPKEPQLIEKTENVLADLGL